MTTIVSNLGIFLDAIFVSRVNGEFLSAIGIVNQPILIIYSIFSDWNIGVAALVSKAKGERKNEKATLILKESIFFSAVLSLLVTVICILNINPILRFMGKNISENEHMYAHQYFRIILLGIVPFSMRMTLQTALISINENRKVFVTNVCGVVLDIFLNYTLIYGRLKFPNMGIGGGIIDSFRRHAGCYNNFLHNI